MVSVNILARNALRRSIVAAFGMGQGAGSGTGGSPFSGKKGLLGKLLLEYIMADCPGCSLCLRMVPLFFVSMFVEGENNRVKRLEVNDNRLH